MFPFNLTGPQFLAFYAVFAFVALIAYWYYTTPGAAPLGVARTYDLTGDPYQIAYLRGGQEEMVRLGIVNLVDRGLLAISGTMLKAANAAHPESLRRPLDRAIIAHCATRSTPDMISGDPAVKAACAESEKELQRKGLLLNEDERRARLYALRFVVLLLGGLAFARIAHALSHGRTNVIFLIILAGIACWVAYRISSRRTTAAGSQALSNVETMMQRLKDQVNRLVPGGATNEALLLAAVFGIHALPASAFPFVEQMFPKPKPDQSDSGGWSSSESGSSGCGGGGGCGGCGGGGD